MARVKVLGVIFGLFYEGMNVTKKILLINDDFPSVSFKENLENSVNALLRTAIKEESPFINWGIVDIVEGSDGNVDIIFTCILPNGIRTKEEGKWFEHQELSEKHQELSYQATGKV